MVRPTTVSDEEVLRRARAVFALRGYPARTREVAAAVGLSWGAIIRRFHDKRSLFDRAMALPEAPAAAPAQGLQDLLEQLHAQLLSAWPLLLHRRLAGLPVRPAGAAPREALARAMAPLAGKGQLRGDLSPAVLASLALTLLAGDIAQRFVEGGAAASPDSLLIGRLLRLLAPSDAPSASWTGFNR